MNPRGLLVFVALLVSCRARPPAVVAATESGRRPTTTTPAAAVGAEAGPRAQTWADHAGGRASGNEDVVHLGIEPSPCWDAEIGTDTPELHLGGFPALSEDGRLVASADTTETEQIVHVVDVDRRVALERVSLTLPPALGPAASWHCFTPPETSKRARFDAVKRHYEAIATRLDGKASQWRRLKELDVLPLRTKVGPIRRHHCAVNVCLEVLEPDPKGRIAEVAVRRAVDVLVSVGADGLAVDGLRDPVRTIDVDLVRPACAKKPECVADLKLVGYSPRLASFVAVEAYDPPCREICAATPPAAHVVAWR